MCIPIDVVGLIWIAIVQKRREREKWVIVSCLAQLVKSHAIAQYLRVFFFSCLDEQICEYSDKSPFAYRARHTVYTEIEECWARYRQTIRCLTFIKLGIHLTKELTHRDKPNKVNAKQNCKQQCATHRIRLAFTIHDVDFWILCNEMKWTEVEKKIYISIQSKKKLFSFLT